MVTNRRVVPQENDGDIYPTPYWATHALMENEVFTGRCIDPAAGDGAMVKVIQEYSSEHVYASDLYKHTDSNRIDFGVDFLDDGNTWNVDNIITNPPYNIADEFLAKALATAKKKVAFLVRLAYMEGQGRYARVYADRPPARVWVFSERITFYKKGATVKGSGTTAYGWFVWDNENPTTTTELKWLPPGIKKRYKDWTPKDNASTT